MQDLQDKFPNAELIGGDAQYEALMAQVVGLIEAPENGLALPLDIRGTAFQQRVWQALRAIPVGETVSYADIARRIGAPKAVRAVAGACAANVLAVAIPCHRVVRNDGALSGYRWGVERKQALLEKRRSDERPAGGAAGQWTGRRLNANSMRRAARGCGRAQPRPVPRAGGALPARCALPQPRRDGAARFWPRRVPVFRLSAAASGGRGAQPDVCTAGAGGNRWNTLLGLTVRYPAEHEAYGRMPPGRPTAADAAAVALRSGDYNCLHQDLYGERVFPLQVAFYFPPLNGTSPAANSC